VRLSRARSNASTSSNDRRACLGTPDVVLLGDTRTRVRRISGKARARDEDALALQRSLDERRLEAAFRHERRFPRQSDRRLLRAPRLDRNWRACSCAACATGAWRAPERFMRDAFAANLRHEP
jgi:hypothetical protein